METKHFKIIGKTYLGDFNWKINNYIYNIIHKYLLLSFDEPLDYCRVVKSGKGLYLYIGGNIDKDIIKKFINNAPDEIRRMTRIETLTLGYVELYNNKI